MSQTIGCIKKPPSGGEHDHGKHKNSVQSLQTAAPTEHLPSRLQLDLAMAQPDLARPQDILEAQRNVGNQTVQRILDPLRGDSELTNEQGELDETINQQIRQASHGGQPLPAQVQQSISSQFSHDFSPVHIHTDAQADQISRQINAQAFTVGDNVFFRHGAYQPEVPFGRYTLAHELAHVIQQSGGASSGAPLTLGKVDDAFEHEADQIASDAMLSRLSGAAIADATRGAAAHTVQRNCGHCGIVPGSAKSLIRQFEQKGKGSTAQARPPLPGQPPPIPSTPPPVRTQALVPSLSSLPLPGRPPPIPSTPPPVRTQALVPPLSQAPTTASVVPGATGNLAPAAGSAVLPPPLPRAPTAISAASSATGNPAPVAVVPAKVSASSSSVPAASAAVSAAVLHPPLPRAHSALVQSGDGGRPASGSLDPIEMIIQRHQNRALQGGQPGEVGDGRGQAAPAPAQGASFSENAGDFVSYFGEGVGNTAGLIGNIAGLKGSDEVVSDTAGLVSNSAFAAGSLVDLYNASRDLKTQAQNSGRGIGWEKWTSNSLGVLSSATSLASAGTGIASSLASNEADSSALGSWSSGLTIGMGALGAAKGGMDIARALRSEKAINVGHASADPRIREAADVQARQQAVNKRGGIIDILKNVGYATWGIGGFLGDSAAATLGAIGSGVSLLGTMAQKVNQKTGSTDDIGEKASKVASMMKSGDRNAIAYAESLGITQEYANSFAKTDDLAELIKIKMGS